MQVCKIFVAWAAAGGSQSRIGSLHHHKRRFYWIFGSILNSSVRDMTMPREIQYPGPSRGRITRRLMLMVRSAARIWSLEVGMSAGSVLGFGSRHEPCRTRNWWQHRENRTTQLATGYVLSRSSLSDIKFQMYVNFGDVRVLYVNFSDVRVFSINFSVDFYPVPILCVLRY